MGIIGAQLPIIVQQPGARGTQIATTAGLTHTINGTYFCGTASVAGSASALNIASIENPAASGRRVFILALEVEVESAASAVSGLVSIGRSTAVPTGGTSETIQRSATADDAPVAIVRSNGMTATAAAGRMAGVVTGTASGSKEDARPISTEDVSQAIQLAEGEAILINSAVSSLNQVFVINFKWVEAT